MGSYGDAWNRAGQDGDEDFDPPTGSYEVIIRSVDLFSGQDGREWCKILYEITDGDLRGRVFQDFGPAGDHNPIGFRFTREKLLLLGLPHDLKVTELEDLAHAAGELAGTRASVGVAHKNGYRNTTVRTSTTGRSDIPPDALPGLSVAPPPASAVDDDTIPF